MLKSQAVRIALNVPLKMLELISIETMELIGEMEIEKTMDMDLKMNVQILVVSAIEVLLLFLRKKPSH
jgi:hypothetical protein